MSFQVFGIAVSQGVAIGRAVLVGAGRVDVAHYFVDPVQVAAEVQRCQSACARVADELVTLRDELPSDAPPELAALLDVHLMLVRDEAFVGGAMQWIVERRYNAEWALAAQMETLGRQFDDMEDEYLRERKSDLEQVVERILTALNREAQGVDFEAGHAAPRDFAGDDPLLLVAADIAPADLIGFRKGVFQGFITDIGGRTSHTAIVARSMNIPAVVGAREASRLIRQDDWVIIDGDAGIAIVDPSPIVLDEYRFRQRQADLERERLSLWRHRPAVTLDGQVIEMLANIELPDDAEAAVASGAEGVGLFRTEFLFMNRGGKLPSEEEQYQAYRRALEHLQGRPLTIRTVDVGADKPLDRAADARHDNILNPALGLRAIRWSLSEPLMLRQQLRAVHRAAAHGPVKLLIPMVAHLPELLAVRAALDQVRAQWSIELDGPWHPVELGIMVEIPATALILERMLPHVDFVSIGTNDLIQYTLAIDRADESVAHLYDPWHPAVLHLIGRVIQQARAAGKSVSVCGEMAGDLSFTELLVGLGLRSFSMNPPQITRVKQRILRADATKLAQAALEVLGSDNPHDKARQLRLL
ncbi:phosphoenolpyruvate--protein phosphotransferase [Inhella crocodyli]|uniref:Phosphoenolpyruvate-protein phosphotransferase n=1 Tax=Inhella crocodyli TaxID=2499851 RepID=A0A437LGU8_9BURK|nr:phosphoenolpyruvate--protein phosphotransferase [Inhella crocodyli]RVT84612.1 phosphoenolpyruvate--protein phosphotransferase [Inhella crocodyli]